MKAGQTTRTNTTLVRETGISVVEIMVALALSLILALGVSQIYLGSRQTYLLQEAQSRLQENGRFALKILADDIRQAGRLGCLKLALGQSNAVNQVNEIALPLANGLRYTAAPPVTGYEGSGGGWLPAPTPDKWLTAPAKATAGTDIINVYYAKSCGGHLNARVEGMLVSPQIQLMANNACNIKASACGNGDCTAGDVLVLSDCGAVEVFRVDAVAGNTLTINGTNSNSQDYFLATHDVDAEVMVLTSRTYFIEPFNGEPSLYRDENTNGATPQPIVEGVEDMQVLYGQYQGDCPKLPNPAPSDYQYLTADKVSDWTKVTAVRLDIILRTTGAEGDQFILSKTNPCNGAAVNDHRLRRCFSTTINIRNSCEGI